jgi:hypothetical protein
MLKKSGKRGHSHRHLHPECERYSVDVGGEGLHHHLLHRRHREECVLRVEPHVKLVPVPASDESQH